MIKTPAATVEEIDLFNFTLNVIHKENTTQQIESYDMFLGYISADPKIPDNNDGMYRRAAEGMDILSLDHIRDRFLYQLDYGDAPIFEGDNLQDLIEQGVIESLQNFGIPTHYMKLNDNLYVVGPVDSESIKLKTISKTEGALVVYKPKSFSILKIMEK